MVDTGELSDRAVAERAGIGWSGKNCAIITPEFGSYVYLGEMITNLPFEPDIPWKINVVTAINVLKPVQQELSFRVVKLMLSAALLF